ncbi:MAG: hypothetical protein K0B81_04915 [Candidatus Cloacimonetes bacterium]|nr:hypothetical protein [Candidatus Cloacimonadota bacterium]
MDYLLDPSQPILPQLLKEVEKEIGISHPEYLIVASSKPELAESFLFPEITTLFVLSPEYQELSNDEFIALQQDLENKNIKLLKGKHLINEAHHSSSQRYRTLFPMEVMAATLANLPESLKHCIENAVWAVDKKFIPTGSLVISIAGTNEIPDTAVLIEPKQSKNMIDSHILKIICHPYQEEF